MCIFCSSSLRKNKLHKNEKKKEPTIFFSFGFPVRMNALRTQFIFHEWLRKMDVRLRLKWFFQILFSIQELLQRNCYIFQWDFYNFIVYNSTYLFFDQFTLGWILGMQYVMKFFFSPNRSLAVKILAVHFYVYNSNYIWHLKRDFVELHANTHTNTQTKLFLCRTMKWLWWWLAAFLHYIKCRFYSEKNKMIKLNVW